MNAAARDAHATSFGAERTCSASRAAIMSAPVHHSSRQRCRLRSGSRASALGGCLPTCAQNCRSDGARAYSAAKAVISLEIDPNRSPHRALTSRAIAVMTSLHLGTTVNAAMLPRDVASQPRHCTSGCLSSAYCSAVAGTGGSVPTAVAPGGPRRKKAAGQECRAHGPFLPPRLRRQAHLDSDTGAMPRRAAASLSCATCGSRPAAAWPFRSPPASGERSAGPTTIGIGEASPSVPQRGGGIDGVLGDDPR